MRVLSKLVFALGGLFTLTAACSSSSGVAPHDDSGTSHDGGGPGTSLSGAAGLTFTPTFVGAGTTSGMCPVCGGLPTGIVGDGGSDSGPTSTGSFPSGPASYDAVVVLLSDDPGLKSICGSDAAEGFSFQDSKYHYLTLQVLSTTTVVPGTYAIHSSLSQVDGGAIGQVDDSVPVTTGTAASLGYENDDNGTGTLTLTVVGSTVQGSFSADGLEVFGGGASQGNLSGSFDAPVCPGLAAAAFNSPCGGCPG